MTPGPALGLLLGGHTLDRLLRHWGEALVFVLVAAQSFGLPLPGTTALISAAIYAGSTHRLTLVGVLAAGLAGALAGSAAGYAAGRWGGAELLARHGHRLRLTPDHVRVAETMFATHGARIVFFGRFITGMRNAVAPLAGITRMPVRRFAAASAAAAFIWAVGNGCAYYFFGRAIEKAGTPVAVAAAVVLVVSVLASARLIRRRARRLLAGDPG